MSTYVTKVVNNPRSTSTVLLIATDGTKVPTIAISKGRAKQLGMSVNKCYLIDTWSKPQATGKALHIIRVHSCLSTAKQYKRKKK